MTDHLVLREAAPPLDVSMSREVAIELLRLGVCDVLPASDPSKWTVSGVRKVGVLRLQGAQITIEPKIPVRSLIRLLAYAAEQAAWRDDEVFVSEGDTLTDAIARAYATALERATSRGLVRSYRLVEETSQVVRGRWDIARQVRTGRSAVVPAEIDFDEFDVDTPANRVLLAAAVLLVRLPGLSLEVARRLRTLIGRFDGVGLMPIGTQAPTVRTDRTSRHLDGALRLAGLVLRRQGIEHHQGSSGGVAFLVTMSTVFERFVQAEVTAAARALGLEVVPQAGSRLDVDGLVQVRPDLTVRRKGRTVAIFDAKYKQEKPAGYPNADVYQALTYAVRHNLREVTLIYAKGLGPDVEYRIAEADVTVRCIALDLEAGHVELLKPLQDLLNRVPVEPITGADTVQSLMNPSTARTLLPEE